MIVYSMLRRELARWGGLCQRYWMRLQSIVRTVTLAGGIQSVVADYPELVEAVLRRGAADGQVRKLVGENISQVAGIPFFAK